MFRVFKSTILVFLILLLTASVAVSGQTPEEYCTRGEQLFMEGKYEEALKSLISAVELDPDYVPALYWRGRTLAEIAVRYDDPRAFDFALADFNHALELDPNNAKSQTMRAWVFRETGKVDQAIAEYGKAIEMDPQYAIPQIGLAKCWRIKGEFEKALAYLAAFEALEPNDIDIYMEYSVLLILAGKNVEAEKHFKKYIEAGNSPAQAYYNRSFAFEDANRSDLEIADLTKAIELKPDYHQAYLNRGVEYVSLKEYDKAIADYTKAIEIVPQFALAFMNRGRAYINMDNFDAGIADFSKAAELVPNHADAYFFRAKCFVNKGDRQTAAQDFTKTVQLDGDNTDYLNARAWNHYQMGSDYYEEAEKDYLTSVAINPDKAGPWYGLGLIYFDTKQYQKAADTCDRCVGLSPKHYDCYRFRGRARDELGLCKEAVQDFEKTVELKPDYYWAWANLSSAARLCKIESWRDYDKSLMAGLKAVEIAPSVPDLWANLAWSYYVKKDLAKANESMQKAINLAKEQNKEHLVKEFTRDLDQFKQKS